MKRLIFVLVIAFAASCSPYDIDEVLLMRDEVSMTVKGKTEFSYNPLTCQMSHNAATDEYRMFDDKISKWVIVRCRQRPSHEGQEVVADLTWTSDSSIKTMNDLSFKIEKTDDSGTIWMWCRKKSIGIVIKNL